jgi:hypothetical protein
LLIVSISFMVSEFQEWIPTLGTRHGHIGVVCGS